MKLKISNTIAICLIGLASHHSPVQAEDDYVDCFLSLRDSFVWPIAQMGESCKSKGAFGPMISACMKPGKYSFTRSMSIDTVLANKAYAVADGKVVYAGNEYLGDRGALRSVILEHEFPEGKKCMYEGQEVKSFYTIYGQLFKGLRKIPFDIGQSVAAGEAVGAVSICGTCPETGPNLLFQLRLNVDYCPDLDGDCADFGSPVHPHLVRPPIDGTQSYTMIRTDANDGENLTVSITTPCHETDIVKYVTRCGTSGGAGSLNVMKIHTQDVNSREGFGPIPALYEQNVTVPYIDPSHNPYYPRQDGIWRTNYVVPSSWFALTDQNQCCSIEASDMWGKTISEQYCGPIAGRL